MACKAYNIQHNTNRFIALIPNSMFGHGDNFDLNNSHVLSALMRKLHEAKESDIREITLWGSGNPRRESIFSEDVADASIFIMENREKFQNKHYNIGTGIDYSIKELADIISSIVGYNGKILWDTSKPDGTPRKLLDSTRFLTLGWKPTVSLETGLRLTYEWYLKNIGNQRGLS